MVTEDNVDVNIGTIVKLSLIFGYLRPLLSHLLGANPSAEEQEESLEDTVKTVNNVVHNFRLQPTSFDKKTYLTYLKVGLVDIPKRLRLSTIDIIPRSDRHLTSSLI